MSKIIEKVLEPSKIEVNSIFKLKIKAIRYLIYIEVKELEIGEIKKYTVKQLKGEVC